MERGTTGISKTSALQLPAVRLQERAPSPAARFHPAVCRRLPMPRIAATWPAPSAPCARRPCARPCGMLRALRHGDQDSRAHSPAREACGSHGSFGAVRIDSRVRGRHLRMAKRMILAQFLRENRPAWKRWAMVVVGFLLLLL